MNIPPFPAQDLAKLVLGYLAEEQLMTAYDEFLSASPYLDAMSNEYDRIFMTSLKNILAEYRAVKIFVETCKPLGLRRRLFGCTNLLEVVKVLIQNVDGSKFQCADRSRGSISNQNIDKSVTCAVCNSLRLNSCVCKSRLLPQTSSNMEGNSIETSVETTSLEDLPGNHMAVRKRHVKTLPKENRTSQSIANSDLNMDTSNSITVQNVDCALSGHVHNLPNSLNPAYENMEGQLDPAQLRTKAQENQRLDQLNILETCTNSVLHHRASTPGTFLDFAEGVREKENVSSIVPDSSTSEHMLKQSIIAKESSIHKENINDLTSKSVTKAHVLLTVGSKGTVQSRSNSRAIEALRGKDQMVNIPDNIRQKPSDQKVTILSDIKVDKTYKNDSSIMPTVLKNATSTPLMQMQTILINGTPVFKPQPPVLGPNRNFTKDEIMAMPTIIVVPTSGGPPLPTCTKPGFVQADTARKSTVSSSALLEPLVIDVPSSDGDTNTGRPTAKTCLAQQKGNELCLLIKTGSVPKDNEVSHKNTPQVAPPLRKSSSTPRRSSHVRVLDFTTPRRILQETISENTGDCECTSVEVVLSKSPSLHTLADPNCIENVINNESIKTNKTETSQINSSGSSKENDICTQSQTPQSGKRNWDADLRALAVPNSKEALSQVPDSRITAGCRRPQKPTVKKNKLCLDKKGSAISAGDKGISDVKNVKPKSTQKSNKAKSKRKSDEVNDDSVIVVNDTASVPVKPTINIITGPDWNSHQESEKEKNLSNKSNDDQTDTPDMDRVSLQNAIGVKLNISDLLETPYKQVLYDIQMETPRFLGSDLPDEPMSDIKIMNIPTPRFLNTPNPPGTPYITRTTDYSSGSSYYRPDDQDYVPVELDPPAPSNKDKEPTNEVKVSVEKVNEEKTKTRPVRKCTKNVSYVSSPANIKPKDTEDKLDAVSTCSETVSVGSINETNTAKRIIKTVKESKPKTKRSSTSKKTKTPVKKETPRSFMKIKPRRPTPTKQRGRGRPRATDSQTRKISISKEKEVAPVVVSVPTKSRRKSSTPRKLHCTKTFNSESSGHESPEIILKNKVNEVIKAPTPCPQDSDSEQIPLRWSDDGSHDGKPTEQQPTSTMTAHDTDDISQIKEYIASELQNATSITKIADIGSNLHVDLVKRGFDLETAKIIEKDLLDTPPHSKENKVTNITRESEPKNDEAVWDRTLESDTSTSLKIVQDNEEEEEEEIELSVGECYEQSSNYISYEYNETEEVMQKEKPFAKLKDKFSMEVCIDDGVVVRLRATPFTVMLDQDPVNKESIANYNKDIESGEYNYKNLETEDYNPKETEMAVNSISNIDKLYTPMKDAIRAQVYDIFESTLTSLDTPLKNNSPRRKECDTTRTEIVLEVEKVDEKETEQESKRKRERSEDSTDSPCLSKKPKPDAQSLLNSASNFNFDIESVLYKLHGS